MPAMVGTKKDTKVHFQLWVSFLMVRRVVAQGKCIRQNNITDTAVSQFQPWEMSRSLSASRLSSSIIEPVDM